MDQGFNAPAFDMSRFEKKITQPQPQKKKKNPLTAFISEAGGTGGALGGAALGTAILPGIGTLLGAGLGGAVGAFGGRVAENQVRDKRFGFGDAAKEGAITGVLSAGPLKLLKAGGAGTKALIKGGTVSENILSDIARSSGSTMRGVGELTKGTRIPVKFLEDAGFETAGKPVTTTANKLLVNPTVGEVAETTSKPGARSILSRYTQPNTLGNATEVPVVRTATTKTNIPISQGTKYGKAVQVFSEAPKAPVAEVTSIARPYTGRERLLNALGAANEAANQPGLISRLTGKTGQFAQRLEARATGLGVGQKIANKELTPQESSRLLQFAIGEGMPMGHPDAKAKWATDKLGEVGNLIDENLTKSNRVLSPQERQSLVSGLLDRVNSDVTLKNNPAAQRTLGELTSALQELENLKGVSGAKRDIQSKVNFIRKNATPTPNREAVLNAAQQTLNDFVGGLNPELRRLNSSYADLSKVNEGVLGAAGKLSGMGEGGGGGLIGRLAGGDIAQTGKSTLGRAGMRATGGPGTSGAIRDSLKYMTRSLAGSALANSGNMQQPEDESLPVNYEQPAGGGDALGMSGVSAQPEQSVYPIQNALADIQKNPKYIDDIIKFYKFANPEPTSASSKVSKPTAQQYGLATSGLNAVDLLGQQLQQDPSLLSRGATPGQGLPLVGGLVSRLAGTGEYQATSNNALDALARARTGAAMTKSEESFYRNFLPKAGDNQQTVNRKLMQLQQAFEPFLGQQGGGSSGEDILAALGY